MKKKELFSKLFILFFLILAVCLSFFKKNKVWSSDIDVVLSLEDDISSDSVWCGTMNLLWNDFMQTLGDDISFESESFILEHLNKGTFTSTNLDENSFYKAIGAPTLDFKKEIEKNIKEKFQETSDILDQFTWNGSTDEYFFYTMLKKEFSFSKAFDDLKKGNFGETKNISFFGISSDTNEEVLNQVDVLYYFDESSYAVRLKTTGEDEIYLIRDSQMNSFFDIYQAMKEKEGYYKGDKTFTKFDTLKVPNLNLKTKKELKELEEITFLANKKPYKISKAVQMIQFELDKKGGKIKSESAMEVNRVSFEGVQVPSRNFSFDQPFVLFLKERKSDYPYFGAKIEDITKFQ